MCMRDTLSWFTSVALNRALICYSSVESHNFNKGMILNLYYGLYKTYIFSTLSTEIKWQVNKTNDRIFMIFIMNAPINIIKCSA